MVEPQDGGWEVVPREVGVNAPLYEGPWDAPGRLRFNALRISRRDKPALSGSPLRASTGQQEAPKGLWSGIQDLEVLDPIFTSIEVLHLSG